jgi:hypothetical protein
MATFFRLTGQELSPDDALEQGRVSVEGDPAAFERCFDVFSIAPRTSAAAAATPLASSA